MQSIKNSYIGIPHENCDHYILGFSLGQRVCVCVCVCVCLHYD